MYTPRHWVLCLLTAPCSLAFAQTGKLTKEKGKRTEKAYETNGELRARKDFVQFAIPALINGSNIDPSPISSFALDLGEKRATLKVGGQLDRKGADAYRWTMTAAPYVGASDGVATLFAKGEGPKEYGGAVGLNFIIKNRQYGATQHGAELFNEHETEEVNRYNNQLLVGEAPRTATVLTQNDVVSRRVQWLALRGAFDQTGYTFFDTAATLENLKSKENLGTGQLLLSYNFFFQSVLKRYRSGNVLFSLGAGPGTFNNAKALDEVELSQQQVVYSADSTAQGVLTSTSKGRIGPLKRSEGLCVYGEIYWAAWNGPYGGAARLGARYTHYAPGASDESCLLSGGLFVTTKKAPTDGQTMGADAMNFAFVLKLDQFQLRNEPGYFKKFSGVQLSAAIPLRFR